MNQKKYFVASAMLLMGALPGFAQTVVIDGFETWNGTTPDGWSVSVPSAVTPTVDAHGGSKAVSLSVIDLGGVGTASGVLTKTFRFASQPVKSVSFWYKANFSMGDYLTIGGLLVSDTINNCSGSMVGSFDITANSSVYTQKNIAYTYSGSCTPNKVRFIDMRIGGAASISSNVKIDDITISSWAVGEKDVIASGTGFENIFPNPARNNRTEIIYRVSNSQSIELNILDISGRVVKQCIKETQAEGRYKYLIEQGQLPAGVYLCELKSGDAAEIQKLIIQ